MRSDFNPSIVFRSVTILLAICTGLASGQQHRSLPKELIQHPNGVNEIHLLRSTKRLFWPQDYVSWNTLRVQHDNLVATKDGLYYLLEGTGRVYQISNQGDSLHFERKDSTLYFGYNYQNFSFSWRDTIFSLGGYGFWRYNGHLRYFRPKSNDWEVMALNREIPINNFQDAPAQSIWLDAANGYVYYPEKRINQISIKSAPVTEYKYYDTSKVWRLNLHTKNWEELGTLSAEAAKIISTSQRIVSSAAGELFTAAAALQKHENIRILDYTRNEILEWKWENSVQISSEIDAVIKMADVSDRMIFYVQGNELVLAVPGRSILRLKLSEKDFIHTGIPVYHAPGLIQSGMKTKVNLVSVLGIACLTLLMGIFGGVLWFKRSAAQRTEGFTSKEIDFIRFLNDSKDGALSADAMNDFLGTSRRSTDLQKKYRSDLIRSINTKFQAVTRTDQMLIEQQRMEEDKRLVRYVIRKDLYQRLFPEKTRS